MPDPMSLPAPPPSSPDRRRRSARRRALVAFTALAIALHAALLGGIDVSRLGASREPAPPASMLVRSVDAKADAAEAKPPPTAPAAAAPRPRPAQPRRPREVSALLAEPVATRPAEPPEHAASEPVFEPVEAMAAAASAATGDAASASAGDQSPAASAPLREGAEPAAASQSASAPSRAASSSFLAAGEEPPPTYTTKLPPPVTLRYEVRRGFFRGTGEIRWQRSGDDYELRLEARIAGLALLAQTSQGSVDANGLAPLRFVDQRARRAAQAANFRRDSGTITFSGPSTEWPLLPGTQDQLSWMIQLAGIVAAEPDRASEGGRVSMVVVDARGQARVRILRYVGRENVETAAGMVSAVKFVADSRSAYDSSDEIWLDPAHDFLPAHATRRSSTGESEFDLLLEAIEPAR
jgi:hypothetical protein